MSVKAPKAVIDLSQKSPIKTTFVFLTFTTSQIGNSATVAMAALGAQGRGCLIGPRRLARARREGLKKSSDFDHDVGSGAAGASSYHQVGLSI
ncbi:hypothetical protein AJ87_30325 [Rhizobium yanglingense]|nr:hypothetical protein AJ87_30325 [Rhizobium yanglingense]